MASEVNAGQIIPAESERTSETSSQKGERLETAVGKIYFLILNLNVSSLQKNQRQKLQIHGQSLRWEELI